MTNDIPVKRNIAPKLSEYGYSPNTDNIVSICISLVAKKKAWFMKMNHCQQNAVLG